VIIAQANIEEILQVNDLTRFEFNLIRTPGEEAIQLVEVEAEAGQGFFDITTQTDRQSKNFLDFAYASSGIKVISLRVSTASQVINFGFSIEVITAETDRLFSNDSDLVSCEDDILNFIRKGRASYLDKHREAQKRIIRKLEKERIFLSDGSRIEPENIQDLEEVRQWSKYLTLHIIYSGLINEVQDVFTQKSIQYMDMATEAGNIASIRIQEDFNNDGDTDDIGEKRQYDIKSTRLIRR